MAQTPASVKSMVATSDLDTTWFAQDAQTKKFKVIKGQASSDAGNLLATGADGFLKLVQAAIQSAQVKYTFGLDATSGKLTLTGSDGTSTAVDPHTFEANLSNAAISNGVITFKDQNGNVTGTLDTTVFLQAVNLGVGNGFSPLAAGANGTSTKPFTLTLLSDPVAGNLLKITATGIAVNTADVLTAVNNAITHTVAVTAASGVFSSTVGAGVPQTLPVVQLQDAAGNPLGLIFANA